MGKDSIIDTGLENIWNSWFRFRRGKRATAELYDYLSSIYDKTFIYDAWSCRIGKGLLGAIERTQGFLRGHSDYFVWRADVRKFFDSVYQKILLEILSLRIKDKKTYDLLEEIIYSFPSNGLARGG